MRPLIRAGWVLGVGGLALSPWAQGRDIDIEYGVGAGLEYSSNIARSQTDGQDDVVGIGNVALSVNKEEGRLRVNSNASLSYQNFKNDTFSDQTLFDLKLDSEGRIVKDRFSWILSDYFTQRPTRSIDPQTPDNQEDTNIFTTGPDLFFVANSRNRFSLGSRYMQFYYQDQEIDNRRYQLLGSWEFIASQTLGFGLSGTAAHVDYDNNDIPDFDIQNAFVRINYLRGRSTIKLDLGTTWIQRDEVENQQGFLGNLDWLYEMNSRSSLQFTAFSRLADSGSNSLTASSTPDFGGNVSGQQSSADTLTTTQAAVTYRHRTGSGYAGRLSLYVTDYNYDNTPQDRREFRSSADVTRSLADRFSATLFGDYLYTDETSTGRKDKTYTLGLRLSYKLGRKLSANLDLQREDRNSNRSENEFDENRVLFSIIYGIGRINPA